MSKDVPHALGDQQIGQFSVVGDPVDSVSRWLCTIAHHHVIDLIRKIDRAKGRDARIDPAASRRTVDPTAARLVEQMLDALPEEDRLLVRLHRMVEMPLAEIVPEILAFREQRGIVGGSTVNEETLKKRWQRLREKMFKHAGGTKEEP